METKLLRIAEVSQKNTKERFTSLAHLINEEALEECHYKIKNGKATGIDKVTKESYEAKLKENIKDLVARMKRQAYKPQPVRRVYIPKAGTDKMRPLGIPSYEDKLVQMVLGRVFNAIYEADFLDCSYGFRPNRNCHDALKELGQIIERKKISYIVDADIKGFFDHVDHEWLMKFIEIRIADPNINRLIVRFLKSGVMERDNVNKTIEGTPQGGNISPVLANIYLHYALDLWFEKVVKKKCKGDAYMVRYADDFVCCFQYEDEAKKFYQALILRLRKFNLEIEESKSKIIAFGRFAEEVSKRLGTGKPRTFDFLGFTHYCGKSKKGKFRVKRKTSVKKFRTSIQRCKLWLRENLTTPAKIIMDKLSRKLTGYYRYYGITDNYYRLNEFRYIVRRMLFKMLNRRSQKKSFNWEKYEAFLSKFPIPTPKIYVSMYEMA